MIPQNDDTQRLDWMVEHEGKITLYTSPPGSMLIEWWDDEGDRDIREDEGTVRDLIDEAMRQSTPPEPEHD